MNLKEYFQKARREKWAIGHFNFSTAEQLKAIVEAAVELKSPVMVATSEGEANFIGYNQAVALVKTYQQQDGPVWLNADHHKSFDSAKKAIDAGYDSTLIDPEQSDGRDKSWPTSYGASASDLEERISITHQVVQYAKTISKYQNIEISVEGELGYLRGSSEVQGKVEISSGDYTQPEQAADFVSRTGVDRLAIVFGNIHGVVTEQDEKLDIEHLKKIVTAVPETTLVLHGASGLSDDDVRAAVAAGISNIHINTEIRVAYHDSLEASLHHDPSQTTPYKFLAPTFEAVKELAKKKLELFGSVDKI